MDENSAVRSRIRRGDYLRGFCADLQDDDANRAGHRDAPNRFDTSIGALELTDGSPTSPTADKIYDNLDRSRALQAYLLGIPIVNQASMRASLRQFGPENQTDVIWETLVDPKTVELTANDNTIYSFIWIDTHMGPLVVEIPPKVLGGHRRFLLQMGSRYRDHGRGPWRRRQVSRAAAGLHGRYSH
jgi:hypothetical protein